MTDVYGLRASDTTVVLAGALPIAAQPGPLLAKAASAAIGTSTYLFMGDGTTLRAYLLVNAPTLSFEAAGTIAAVGIYARQAITIGATIYVSCASKVYSYDGVAFTALTDPPASTAFIGTDGTNLYIAGDSGVSAAVCYRYNAGTWDSLSMPMTANNWRASGSAQIGTECIFMGQSSDVDFTVVYPFAFKVSGTTVTNIGKAAESVDASYTGEQLSDSGVSFNSKAYFVFHDWDAQVDRIYEVTPAGAIADVETFASGVQPVVVTRCLIVQDGSLYTPIWDGTTGFQLYKSAGTAVTDPWTLVGGGGSGITAAPTFSCPAG